MLNITKRSLLQTFILALLFIHPLTAQDKSISLVGNDQDYTASKATDHGPTVSLLMEAFKRSGYTTTFIVHAWTRALQETHHQNFDVLIGAYHSEEREKIFSYSRPYAVARLSFMKLKALNIEWETYEDLAPYKFAVVRGGFVSNEFLAANYLQKINVDSLEAVIRMVIRGRVELGITEELLGRAIVENKFPHATNLFDFVSKPAALKTVHLVVSKNHPRSEEILEAFNRGLDEMVKDGTYSLMMQENGLTAISIPEAHIQMASPKEVK